MARENEAIPLILLAAERQSLDCARGMERTSARGDPGPARGAGY